MARKKIADLFIDVSANVAKIQKDLGNIDRKVNRSARAWSKSMDMAKTAIAGFITVQAIRSSSAYFKGIIDQADAFEKLGVRVGISTEKLSAYTFAAELAGSSQEELNVGLRKLAKNATEAAERGGTMKDNFDAMGVAVKDAAGNVRPLDDIFQDVAESISQMTNKTERAARAQQIYGRSGVNFVSFLRDGKAGLAAATKEAKELGRVISDDFARDAAEANDALTRMSAVTNRVGVQFAMDLAPAVGTVANAFAEAAKDGGLLEGAIAGVGKALKLSFTGEGLDPKFKDELTKLNDTVVQTEARIAKLTETRKKLAAAASFLFDPSKRIKEITDDIYIAEMNVVEAKQAIAELTERNTKAAKERLNVAKEAAEIDTAARDAANKEEAKRDAGLEADFLKGEKAKAAAEAKQREDLLDELRSFGLSKSELLREEFERDLALLDENEEAKKVLRAKYDKERIALDKGTKTKERRLTVSHFGMLAGAVSTFAKEGTKVQRVAAATNAVIKAHEAANMALASAPPPFGQILAGITLAAGLKNAKAILSADGASASGGTAGAATAAPPPAAAPAATPDVAAGTTINATANFMGTAGRDQFDQWKQWLLEDLSGNRNNHIVFS